MQRRALAFLFTFLSLALVGIAIAALAGAHGSVRWVIAVAAFALAAWLASVALQALRPRR